MKIENQVCSLEQAKKLKELGIAQDDKRFMWFEVSNGDDEGDFEAEGVEWEPILTQYHPRDKEHYAVGAIDGDLTTSDGQFCSYKPDIYNAFTVAELGILLPDLFFFPNTNGKVKVCRVEDAKYLNGKHIAYMQQDDKGQDIHMVCYKIATTEAEARAAILIHLLENKLITAESCNERLSD